MTEQTSAYWLNKAEEARTRADQMHSDTSKTTLLDIASKYDQMAQRAEGRDDRQRTSTKKRR